MKNSIGDLSIHIDRSLKDGSDSSLSSSANAVPNVFRTNCKAVQSSSFRVWNDASTTHLQDSRDL